MAGSTPKWALPYSQGSDLINTIDNTDQARATLLDGLLSPFDQGVRSSRPVSTAGTPGKVGRTYRSTDDGGIDRDYGTGWTTERPGLFSALPGTPDDGMLISFQTAAMKLAGVGPWRLRYDSTAVGVYRWAAEAAAPLIAEQAPSVSLTDTTGTLTDFSDAAPFLALPLAGDYAVTHGAGLYHSAAGASLYLTLAAAGLAVAVGDGLLFGNPPGSVIAAGGCPSRTRPVRGISGLLKMQYSQTVAGGSAYWRFLSARPLRVG